MIPKAVVALAGARDHYQLPLALAEGDLLDSLITDLYLPLDVAWVRQIIRGNFRQLAYKRYQAGLKSQQVTSLLSAFGASLISQAYSRALPRFNRTKDTLLGRATRARAIERRSAIFTYSYYARSAFAQPFDELPYRFLFQVHPNTYGARRLLSEELSLVPQGAASLRREYELSLSDEQYAEFAQETASANGLVVASSFTAQMLVNEGIPRERIFVTPYGVDLTRFSPRQSAPDPTQPLTIMFLGQLVQRKGLSYLLEAIRLLKTRQVRLLLCGHGFVDHDLLSYYADVPQELHLGRPYSEVLDLMRGSDVFVFPSLLEGFGLVLLESMACGVPIIASTNTVAPDLIDQGKQGFIVPIRSPETIAERLDWAIDHRAELAAMGNAAAARAQRFTWEHFREQVRNAYGAMITNVDQSAAQDHEHP